MKTRLFKSVLVLAVAIVFSDVVVAQDSGAAAGPEAAKSTAAEAVSPPVLVVCELGTTPNVHRFGSIFTAGQPPLKDFAAAKKDEGLRTVINLRTPLEMVGSSQEAELKKLAIGYYHIPFGAPDTLTDQVFDTALKIVSDRTKHPIMVHCKSANRVGAIWLVHRVLNDKKTYEKALEEAHEVGLRFPPYEEKARAYIAKQKERERQRDDRLDQLADEWQYPRFSQDFGGGATGSVRNSVQECEDDYGRVWDFYSSKCGFTYRFSDKKLYRTVRSEGATTYLLDDHPGTADGKFFRKRTFFVCNTPDYSVLILVVQSDEESTPTRVYRTITVQDSIRAMPLKSDDSANDNDE